MVALLVVARAMTNDRLGAIRSADRGRCNHSHRHPHRAPLHDHRMTTSLFDLTIPVFIRGLEAMSGFLAKGEAHAAEQHVDPADYLDARLIEDMAPLTA